MLVVTTVDSCSCELVRKRILRDKEINTIQSPVQCVTIKVFVFSFAVHLLLFNRALELVSGALALPLIHLARV